VHWTVRVATYQSELDHQAEAACQWTSTVKVPVEALPAPSVAVTVTVVVPGGKIDPDGLE
jgi:hypothetical protein